MLQEQEPGRKPLLLSKVQRFQGGNSNILNQGGKTKILRMVLHLLLLIRSAPSRNAPRKSGFLMAVAAKTEIFLRGL